jgi:hypothetical protein
MSAGLARAALKQSNPISFSLLMSINNSLGFIVLGLLLYATPVFAQSIATQTEVVMDTSVRTLWLEFMGWVTGGIGIAYLLKEAASRMPTLLTMEAPEHLLRSVEVKAEPVRYPVGVSVSS